MGLKEIEEEITYFENIINNPAFDTYPYTKKREIIQSWLRLKEKRNSQKKYHLKERMKMKTIKKTFGFIDDLDELKLKSRSQWEKARSKARKMFKKQGLVK